MSAHTILLHQIAASPLTKTDVEQMSDDDLNQSIVFTIAVAKDRMLTDIDVANFWRVYEEKNKRARK
jgi:hypothetical protein